MHGRALAVVNGILEFTSLCYRKGICCVGKSIEATRRVGLHFWDALFEIVPGALLRELVEYKRIEPHGLRSPCEC